MFHLKEKSVYQCFLVQILNQNLKVVLQEVVVLDHQLVDSGLVLFLETGLPVRQVGQGPVDSDQAGLVEDLPATLREAMQTGVHQVEDHLEDSARLDPRAERAVVDLQVAAEVDAVVLTANFLDFG